MHFVCVHATFQNFSAYHQEKNTVKEIEETTSSISLTRKPLLHEAVNRLVIRKVDKTSTQFFGFAVVSNHFCLAYMNGVTISLRLFSEMRFFFREGGLAPPVFFSSKFRVCTREIVLISLTAQFYLNFDLENAFHILCSLWWFLNRREAFFCKVSALINVSLSMFN